MADETYAEALVNISIKGGIIRLDFGSQEVPDFADTPSGEKPAEMPMTVRQRVVMPLVAFGQAFGMQEQVMNQLIEDGLFTRNTNDGIEATSPNFES